MRWLPLLVAVLAPACGGTTASTSDAGPGSDSAVEGGNDSSLLDAGADTGCPGPPPAPVYACDAAAPDAQSCGPWSSTASSPRYPEGCVVTTTMEGTFCGPVTCNCMTEFMDGGATWVCPL